MKFSTIVCCGLIAVGSASPAVAGPDERGKGLRPLVQDQRLPANRGREAERSAPRREMRGQGNADRGRMSQEDRRQLRRDIQDAGQDIYQRERQGRGEGRRSRGR